MRLGAQAALIVGTVGAAYAMAPKVASATKAATTAATSIISGANQVSRGSVQVGQAIYEHASSEHLTESAKYDNTQHRADREQERLISGLREVSKSYVRSLETIGSTMNERDQTPLMLARNIA